LYGRVDSHKGLVAPIFVRICAIPKASELCGRQVANDVDRRADNQACEGRWRGNNADPNAKSFAALMVFIRYSRHAFTAQGAQILCLSRSARLSLVTSNEQDSRHGKICQMSGALATTSAVTHRTV